MKEIPAMFQMIWPLIIIIGANTFYNIIAKATPSNIHPFASLTITYIIATLFSLILFFLTSKEKNILSEMSKGNWASIAFGCCLVILEFGYIYLYRAGWNVSIGSLIANIGLACVLLIVGLFIYHEVVTIPQLFGMAFCLVGLFLISK